METARDDLLRAVDRVRTKRQMSNRQFCKHILGIDHSYLSLLKAGKRPLTPNVAVRFMQKLPEITLEVTNFVVSQGNNDAEKPSPKKCFENPSENRGESQVLDNYLPPPPKRAGKPSKNVIGG